MKSLTLKIYKAKKKILLPITTTMAKINFRMWDIPVGKNLKVKGKILLAPMGKMEIGNNVRINSGPIHVGGSVRRTAFRIAPSGRLVIKDNVGISNSTFLCFDYILIEEGANIGGGCEFMDGDGHALDSLGRKDKDNKGKTGQIIVGKNAFIGGMCIIRRGVTIGEGAVVGTGSLVTKSVPPYEIWGGVPAKLIRKLEGSDE